MAIVCFQEDSFIRVIVFRQEDYRLYPTSQVLGSGIDAMSSLTYYGAGL